MHHSHPSSRRLRRSRCLSLLLALALLLGLVPGLELGGGGSAHWADPYLSQLVEWGYIRPDQAQEPNDELTRADFMSITNRAYGYHENGPTPFVDVKESDWFYDDVGIAYTAQYIKGTSETTVSPDYTLTRETATTILGRNMMLKESTGEILDFSDARDISTWSRGVIKSSLEHYLVGGYNDGTFRPQKSVTWGEMAAMLTKIVGTPLQEAGDYSLGGVFGNVTISSPGVTLRDTVISGDLYVTGGVGLGGIVLENVVVLGRIICSGTGEAESGEASVLLRNVTADELLIDSLQGKTVSVQADGVTEIGKTQIRTSAYIQDNTPDGMGLHSIVMDAPLDEDAEPLEVTFAGRVEEVLNLSPESTVHVAKGTLAKLTVDEAATGSLVLIDRGGEVKELNLDVGTHVTGEGDIKHLNVNAPGSVVDILPEEITIRPGITAVIDGEEMDTIDAEQSNMEPQILSGYPYASDIAPNSISALFATNKKGTIYWAVSPINDGSVATEDLIKPPVYGGISVARGTLASPAADTEVRAAVTGLVPGGAYYLSAVMVDDRGVQSPTKVISFETPDNSVPAFAQGYPYFSLIEDTRAQIAVMPTKDCNLYYAVMPSGAAAPTEDELKTGSVSGALGYGVRPVTKNVADLFWVNDLPLEELVSYDLYLWLVDANGANKSNIVKLTFKTVDRTPPEFIIDPTPNKIQAASVGLTFRLNENGTVYWAVVPAGKTFLLPNLAAGQTAVDWSSDYAKLQVTSGMNAQSFGNVRATQNADGTITVNGLEAEKAYDFYYVAVDTAGNYSRTVKMITINSLDTNGPKFTQTFTKYSGLDNTTNPMVDTGIVLHVTENIRVDAEGAGDSLLSLYQASIDQTSNTATRNEAKDKLVTSLKNSIVLNRVTSGSGQGSQPVIVRYDQLPSSPNKKENDNWVIDYEKVTVTMKDNVLDITFPADALQLDSGATYYFTVSNVTDTSTAQNRIVPSTIDFYTNAAAGAAAGHDLRPFTTMLGQFYLTRTGLDTATELPKDSDGANIPVDYSFRVVPRATKNMENNMCYDLLFFTDSVISFDLYYRVVHVDANGNNPQIVDLAENSQYWLPNWDTCAHDANNGGWYKLGTGANGASGLVRGNKSDIKGVSLNGRFNNCDQGNYPKLNVLDDSGQTYYEFAISVCQKDSTTVRSEWSGSVNISVYAAAAPSTNLSSLTRYPDFTDNWEPFLEDGLTNGGGVSIGITDQSSTFLSMDWPFTDSRIPLFMNDYPHITPGDTYVDMELALDQTSPGSVISYVIAPEGGITPRVLDQNSSQTPQPQLTEADLWNKTPLSGAGNQPGVPNSGSTPQTPAEITSPEAVAIAEHMYNNNSFKMGKITYEGNGVRVPVTETDLIPNQNYYVYFVFSNTSGEMSKIFMYKFTTSNLAKPMIDLSLAGGKVDASTHVDSVMEYTMATSSQVWRQPRFRELVKNNAVTPPDNLLIPEGYAEMTLLEALTSPYTTSLAREHATGASGGDYSGYYIPEEYGNSTSTMGYSVFDVYVRDAMKETIAVLIRSGSGIDGFVAKGTLNTTANLPQPIDETKNGMTVNTNYIVLTVAHHKSGSIDSFKAIDYVVLPDEQPPKPIKISTYIPDGGIRDGAQQKLYSGVVTIEFDKDLYWLDNNAREAIPVYATSSKPGAQDQWIDIISPMNSVLQLGISGMQSMSPTRTFILSFQDITPNASFSIFSIGHFASSAGTAEPDSLRLTFKVNEGKDAGFETDWTKNRVTVEKNPIQSQPAELVVTNAGNGVNLVGKKLEFNLGDTNPTATTSSLFATVNPNPDNYVYTWSSSNPSIASVSPAAPASGRNATVEAHTIGTATITVTAGGVTEYISVTVNGSVVVRQSNGNEVLENQTLSTQLGTPIVLTATPTPSSAPLLWESSSDRIATVNNGTITTVSTGTATITVSSNGIKLRTFKVTVTNPPEGSDSGLVIARP